MKTNRYSDPLILSILRQAQGGVAVADLCREHGMSRASFYKWRATFGGMDASMISEVKSFEDENRRHHTRSETEHVGMNFTTKTR